VENLLSGEISFAKKEYEGAVESFEKVISLTGDDYLRYRAYHTSDEIFRIINKPERSVELLSSAMNRLPINRVPEMTERLADAYVKCGDYQNAIALFEKLLETGAPQFHIMQNLAILLQSMDQLDRAADLLSKMADEFPNDYRVPMRQTYLEADRQSKIANEDRDYSTTQQYYGRAVDLYNKNVKPGNSDPEMQQLDNIIGQLRSEGWIE